jgi:hypothetical protein
MFVEMSLTQFFQPRKAVPRNLVGSHVIDFQLFNLRTHVF